MVVRFGTFLRRSDANSNQMGRGRKISLAKSRSKSFNRSSSSQASAPSQLRTCAINRKGSKKKPRREDQTNQGSRRERQAGEPAGGKRYAILANGSSGLTPAGKLYKELVGSNSGAHGLAADNVVRLRNGSREFLQIRGQKRKLLR